MSHSGRQIGDVMKSRGKMVVVISNKQFNFFNQITRQYSDQYMEEGQTHQETF